MVYNQGDFDHAVAKIQGNFDHVMVKNQGYFSRPGNLNCRID
jgi:hypothetical protein